jgi:uncharacterized protein with GYD domain
MKPRYILTFEWPHDPHAKSPDSGRDPKPRQVRAALEPSGIEFEEIYSTVGRVELVAVVRAPSHSALSAALFEMSVNDRVRTETMRAFDTEDLGCYR